VIVKILYFGRRRILDKLRSIVFDTVEIRFLEDEKDFERNPEAILLLDKATISLLRDLRKGRVYRKYLSEDLDEVDFAIILTDVISKITLCRDIVVGVDPGEETSGVAIIHCQVPTIHLMLSKGKLARLLKALAVLAEESKLNLRVCVGIGNRKSPERDLTLKLILSISRDVPIYLIDEERTKYRRSIYRTARKLRNVLPDEFDAVVYALSIEEGIRFVL